MSNPDIPADISRQMSLVPEVEDSRVPEGLLDEVDNEISATHSSNIQRKISSTQKEEGSDIAEDQDVREMSSALILSAIPRNLSSRKSAEPSGITEGVDAQKLSAPSIQSDIQENIPSTQGDNTSEVIEDPESGEISLPVFPSDIQREISSVSGNEANGISEGFPDQESSEINAPLIPSMSLMKTSLLKADETNGMTEGQEACEEIITHLSLEIQRKLSSALVEEVNGVNKDQEAEEMSSTLQFDIQRTMSLMTGYESCEISDGQDAREDSVSHLPLEIQNKLSSTFVDEVNGVDKGSVVESILLKHSRIIGDKIRKPFIGGYILHSSKTEFHNASTNTTFLPQSHIFHERKLERSTQTQWSDSPKVLDTAITAATQTPVRGLHLLEPFHTYITPGKLTEIQPIDDEVIKIQRWWRNWLKRKRILIYLEGVKRQDEAWIRELDKVPEERQKLKAKLHFSVDSLKTEEDFEHAYFAIELERKRQIKIAQSSYTGHLLNFAYVYILMQEINILQKIDQQKSVLSEGKKIRQRHNLLNELAAPRTWISKRDGKPIAMETKIEREFAQWKNIYNNLTMTGLSSDQRREVLNSAYAMLEMHDVEDVHHIKDMITQELVLLVIGVDMEKLQPFHSILEHNLFDHLESYALKNRTKLQEYKLSRLKSRLHVCMECHKVKPESSFDANTRTKELVKCKSCVKLQNMSCKRKDYAIFRHILASLRKEETRLRCSSPVAFIIQVEDIYYLINSIWHAHSALSHKRELEDLRLCRFDNSVDWSPWNCILLTHEEMLAHRLVPNPYTVYGECLIKMVQSKHQIAREYFKFLRDVSDRHNQTIEWLNIKKSKPYKYYAVNAPSVSYVNQPEKIKLNPSKNNRPAGKCNAEIQRL